MRAAGDQGCSIYFSTRLFFFSLNDFHLVPISPLTLCQSWHLLVRAMETDGARRNYREMWMGIERMIYRLGVGGGGSQHARVGLGWVSGFLFSQVSKSSLALDA